MNFKFDKSEIKRLGVISAGTDAEALFTSGNIFSGNNIYGLKALKQATDSNGLGFVINNIDMDQIGDIVPDKNLSRINAIINYQKKLRNTTEVEQLSIFNKKFSNNSEIFANYQNPEIYKKISQYVDDVDKASFLKSNNIDLRKTILTDSQRTRMKTILGINNSEDIFMFDNIELANKYKTFSGKETFVKSIHENLINKLNGSHSINASEITYDILKRINETKETMEGITDRQAEYKALGNLKEKIHLFASEIYDEQISNIISTEDGAIKYHKFIKENIIEKIPTVKRELINDLNRAIMSDTKSANLIDNFASIRIEKSAAISPREGSSITNFIKNEAEEIFKLAGNDAMAKEHARKKNDFLKAINLVYGEYYIHDIEKKLDIGDTAGIKTQLDNLSGIVLGEKRHYKQIGFNDLFITKDIDINGKIKHINQKATYVDLLRNPHQYIGSIKPTRAVYLTDADKRLSFLKDFIGDEAKVNQGQSNIMLIGKRTALSANADFDGDVMQLMKYTAADFSHITDPIEKKKLLKKLDLSRELYYILNDHSGKGYDLEAIFNDPDFLTKHKNDQYFKMFQLTQSLSGMDNNNYKITPNEAFKKIEKQYNILKFENIRTTDAMIDESTQHANLPTLGKQLSRVIENKNKGTSTQINISQKEFEDFVLGLSPKDKKHIFFGAVNEDNIDAIDGFFDTTNVGKEIKTKLQAFNKLNKKEKMDTFYDFFNQIYTDTNGILKFNHLRLAESGYEAYTGVSRTGMIHDTLTAVREANSFVNQPGEYDNYIKRLVGAVKQNGSKGAKISNEEIDLLKRMKNFSGSFASFNTLGTLIEKLSISSKLGGKVDPYISGANITKFNKLIRESSDLTQIINFDAIEELSNSLVKNMENNEFIFRDKKINTINDLTNIFIKNDVAPSNVKGKRLNVKNSLDNVFGALFEVDIKKQDFSYTDLNVSNNKILSAVANAASVITKGTIENVTGTTEVVNGLKNIVNGNQNIAVTMNEYLNDISNAGDINQKTSIRHQYIEKIKSLSVEKPIVGAENIPNIQTTTDSKLTSTAQNTTEATNALQQSKRNNVINAPQVPNNVSDISSKGNTSGAVEKHLNQATANLYTEEITAAKSNMLNLENEKKGLVTEIEKLKMQLNDLTKNIFNNSEELDPKLSKHTEEISENLKGHFNSIIKGLEDKIVELNKTIDANKVMIDSMETEINSYKQEVGILSKAKNIAEDKIKNFMNTGKKTVKTSAEQSGNADESIETLRSFASKHKKIGIAMGTAAVLGMFFRIFQSNRPVVDLTIDKKEYEKSQGSIYRSLGNYNIQTNIRSFY